MECNRKNLQMYLDGELEPQLKKAVETHLGRCRSCRQEMARLQLLWLELEQEQEVDLPMELPFFRQQIIHQAFVSKPDITAPNNYWGMQKLAWQPALLGASHMPGISMLSTISRSAGAKLPKLKSGTWTLAKKLLFSPKEKK